MGDTLSPDNNSMDLISLSTQHVINPNADFKGISFLNLIELGNGWQFVADFPFKNSYRRLKHRTFLFDGILIALNCFDRSIWCLDMKNDEKKWSKGEAILPKDILYSPESIWLFTDKYDNVHVIEMNCGKMNGKHFESPARKLISKELRKERKKRYLPIAMGYLRE